MEFNMYHPLDVQYNLMSTRIEVLDPNSKIYEVIETALSNTHADSHSQL